MHNFMFIVISIIHLSSYTSASWLHAPFNEPPPTPEGDRDCVGWLRFYDFGEDAVKNRDLAMKRNKEYDGRVNYVAVIYAHVLIAFPKINDGPLHHCMNRIGYEVFNNYRPFISVNLPCANWIMDYGYDLEDKKKNRLIAKNRDYKKDGEISVFAAGYGRFVVGKKRTNFINIIQYCEGIGVGHLISKPYMSFSETKKSCAEWIHISEYGNIDANNQLKYKSQDKKFMDYMNIWTKRYIEYLKSLEPKTNIVCQSSTSVNEFPWTPTEFCDENGWGGSNLYTYFGDN